MPEGTETQQTGADNTTQDGQQSKPAYTPEQQEHINKMVQERLSRQEKTLRTDFDKQMNDRLEALRTELAPHSKTEKKTKETEEAETAQARQLIEQEKANAAQAKQRAQQLEKDLEIVRTENKTILKKQEVRRAMSDAANFFNPDEVMLLTQDRIELDPESGRYVVRENGVIKMNSSMEPMTLEDYFKGYAQARPYLVRGDVKGGAGSAESNRAGGNLPGVIRSKADLKTAKEKSVYIDKFGLDAFEKLPLKS